MARFIPSVEGLINRLLDSPAYRPMTRSEMARALRIGAGRRAELRAALRAMERRGEAVCLRKNRWGRPGKDRLFTGVLRVHRRGFAFVADEKDPAREALVPAAAVGVAVHGDRVLVEAAQERGRRSAGRRRTPAGADAARGALRARVVRVLERRFTRIPGLLKSTPYYAYVLPDDTRFTQPVRVRGTAPGVSCRENEQVVVELDPWDASRTVLCGVLVESLGPADAADAAARGLVRQYGLGTVFPEAARREARRRPLEPGERDLRGRRDLRDDLVFTIDPADARDFDDAVALRREDGGWVLDVHIADVAHFVPPGGAMDREARGRGNTVYLVDRALTMLPPHLTGEVCSLRPDRDRLTRTFRIRLAPDGRAQHAESFPSVIRSRVRLDYDRVQELLDGATPSGLPPGVADALRDMHALSRLRRGLRTGAGALDFQLPEVRCVLDASGAVTAIRPRAAAGAYALIEEFMLLANEAAARALAVSRGPALYRAHDEPDDAQWAAMEAELASMGVRLGGRRRTEVNAAVRAAESSGLGYPAALAVLRNLKRACYTPEHRPHFGLATADYTHFTSPIRRYPDLVVHRLLGALEHGGPPPYPHGEIAEIAAHCSRTEREAGEAERESVDIKRVGYYEALLRRGDTGPWPAVVVQVLSRGLLVELPATLQRGLVPRAVLRRDRGPGARDGGRAGALLDVELLRVDTARRLVDFRPAGRTARPARRYRTR